MVRLWQGWVVTIESSCGRNAVELKTVLGHCLFSILVHQIQYTGCALQFVVLFDDMSMGRIVSDTGSRVLPGLLFRPDPNRSTSTAATPLSVVTMDTFPPQSSSLGGWAHCSGTMEHHPAILRNQSWPLIYDRSVTPTVGHPARATRNTAGGGAIKAFSCTPFVTMNVSSIAWLTITLHG